jgi:hypothetical protein
VLGLGLTLEHVPTASVGEIFEPSLVLTGVAVASAFGSFGYIVGAFGSGLVAQNVSGKIEDIERMFFNRQPYSIIRPVLALYNPTC